jgi:hypothetical protein
MCLNSPALRVDGVLPTPDETNRLKAMRQATSNACPIDEGQLPPGVADLGRGDYGLDAGPYRDGRAYDLRPPVAGS